MWSEDGATPKLTPKQKATMEQLLNQGASWPEVSNAMSQMSMNKEAQQLMASWSSPKSASDQIKLVRKLIALSGTDWNINDGDAYGNGDQSRISTEDKAQIVRNVWSQGGDIELFLLTDKLSLFALVCLKGDLTAVQLLIKKTKRGSQERTQLLERRETSCRLSPVLLTIAMSKHKATIQKHTGMSMSKMNHLGVVQELILHGATPDARDFGGKTAAHYGAGSFATKETLDMVDTCIGAAKISASYGEEVVLYGLSKTKYNEKKGVLDGYVSKDGRCAVYVKDLGSVISLKDTNLRLAKDSETNIKDDSVNLINMQDRYGSGCLHEVAMSNREDLLTFLLDKHNASLDIAEYSSGATPRKMAVSMGTTHPVCSVMKKHLVKQGRKEKKSELKICDQCGKKETKPCTMKCCSRCKMTYYCNRECQLAHYPAHKKACKANVAGVTISESDTVDRGGGPNGGVPFLLNAQSGARKAGGFNIPKGIKAKEKFWVKVQANDRASPLMVYDKSRSCSFLLKPENDAHGRIFDKVQAERTTLGRKTHFEATFDSDGTCTIYPNTAELKKW